MATWEDLHSAALALPETVEGRTHGSRAWRVRDKTFVWERPLRRGELEELGAAAGDGPVFGAHVPDLGAKAAVLASDPAIFFTTAHFERHASVLVRLEAIELADLAEVVLEAWLARAPKLLAEAYLETELPR